MFVAQLALIFLRIYLVQGYFIVAYGLGIFLLNNFIAFLSPLEDMGDSGPMLPKTEKEGSEFKPFTRRLPEFKFWLACFRGTGIALLMTFFLNIRRSRLLAYSGNLFRDFIFHDDEKANFAHVQTQIYSSQFWKVKI